MDLDYYSVEALRGGFAKRPIVYMHWNIVGSAIMAANRLEQQIVGGVARQIKTLIHEQFVSPEIINSGHVGVPRTPCLCDEGQSPISGGGYAIYSRASGFR